MPKDENRRKEKRREKERREQRIKLERRRKSHPINSEKQHSGIMLPCKQHQGCVKATK